MCALYRYALDCMAHILGSTLPLYFIDMAYLAITMLTLSMIVDKSMN